MRLLEISIYYSESAARLRGRMQELRDMEKAEADPEQARRIRRRIEVLAGIWRETRDIAALTAHYYD
ncbi:MAG: hypothetical protein HFG08_06325 [Oscillibacter sp.]|nr:hypothetical protein [Oscillibacter sp.]